MVLLLGLLSMLTAHADVIWHGCRDNVPHPNQTKSYFFNGILITDEGVTCSSKYAPGNVFQKYYPNLDTWAGAAKTSCDGSKSGNHVDWDAPPYPYPGYNLAVFALDSKTNGSDTRLSAQAAVECTVGYFLLLPQPGDQDTSADMGIPETGCKACSKEDPPVGHPIDPSNGNEYESQTDFVDPNGRLSLRRSYNSNAVDGTVLGTRWRHNFDAHIRSLYNGLRFPYGVSAVYDNPADACTYGWPQIAPAAARVWPTTVGTTVVYDTSSNTCRLSNGQTIAVYNSGNTATFVKAYPLTDNSYSGLILTRPDGTQYPFYCINGSCQSNPDVPVTLTAFSGGFTLVNENGDTEIYSDTGDLVSIAYKNGDALSLGYDGNYRLSSVTDGHGRSLVFTYDSNGQLHQVSAPDGSAITYGYDTVQQLATVTYPDNKTRTYQYDLSGGEKLTAIVDENNSTYATFGYDPTSGFANSSVLAGGADAVSIQYSPGTAKITDALGAVRYYNYQSVQGRQKIASITGDPCPKCSVGAATTFDPATGYLSGSTDWNGNHTAYTYDSAGELQVETDAQGTGVQRTTTTHWDDVLRNPLDETVQDDVANQTMSRSVWTYNTRGQATFACQIDPSNATAMSYACGSLANAPTGVKQAAATYCEQADITAGTCPLLGLLTSVNGPRTDVPDVTTYTYFFNDDPNCASVPPTTCTHRAGDLHQVTNAVGQTTNFLSYDGAGRLLSLTDANGVETDLQYSARGWLTQVARRAASNNTPGPGDEITGYGYDYAGQLKTLTRPDGSSLTFTYDAAHRLTDIADNLGDNMHYTLDAAGNRLREDTTDSSSTTPKHSVVRTFDTLGELYQSFNANGGTVNGTYAYDANGNQKTFTDGRGTITNKLFDQLNRLYHVEQDPGSSPHVEANTTLTYDALDRTRVVNDPHGLNTSYTYDGLDNLTTLTSPDTGTATATFDHGGDLKTRTDARGTTATYTYDALGRVKTITYPTTALKVTYTYDTVMAACDQTTQVYAVGHVSQIQDGSGYTRFCYDRFGNVARRVNVINGTSFTTNFAYDLAHHLTQVTTPKSTIITYTRDAIGRVTGVTYKLSGGTTKTVVSNVTYYPNGPVASITYGNGRVLNRSYDADYVVQSISDTGSGGLNLVFGRDVIGNLTGLTNGSASNTLAYDGLNRLTGVTDPNNGNAQIAAWQYDATGNRLTQQAGTSSPVSYYTYPSDSHHLIATGPVGNSVTRGYDAMGNTTSVGSGGTGKAFHYDDTGRMDQLQDGNGGVLMQYATNAMGQRVEKYLTGNSAATQYTIDDESGQVLGEYDGSSARIREVVWMDGMPVGVITPGPALSYLEPDQLGTPRVGIGSGTNTQTWSWSPVSDPFGQGQPTGSLSLDLRMPGQTYDSESGLNYNNFRDYDSATGRYAQSDPMGLSGGISTYAYAGGSPLNSYDPEGLMKLPANPNGLPPGWTPDPTHRDPNGERFRDDNGNYLDFHKGRQGKPGWRGKDHWHYNGCDDHLTQGDEVPDPMPNVPGESQDPPPEKEPSDEGADSEAPQSNFNPTPTIPGPPPSVAPAAEVGLIILVILLSPVGV